jgi:hypothetical protein
MGWPLRSSIEHIDHILVFMGLVSQVACHHQMFGFTPSASLASRGEKLGETCKSLSRARGCIGSTGFSGAEDLSSSVDDYVKSCHVHGLLAGSICVAYMNWCGKRTCRVDQVFPCRVYIDSN